MQYHSQNPCEGGSDCDRLSAGADGQRRPDSSAAPLDRVNRARDVQSSAALLNRQGLSLEAAQRFTEAEQAYRAAIAVDQGHPDACLNLAALIYRHADRYEEAVALCTRALELKPDWVNAHVLLGCVYQSRSAWDRARACHRRALEIAPNLTEAHQNLGLICAAQDRHAEAVDHFRRALTHNPACARTWNDLGISLRACGLLREAVGAYCSAIECCRDFAVAWFHKGNVLQDLKYYDEAAQAYRRAVELDAHLPGAWNNLGVVLRAQNLHAEALEAFCRAAEQDPLVPEVYSNAGLSLEALGRSEEAVISFRKAIGLDPDFAEAYRDLGDSFKEMSRMDEAIAAYRKAIGLRCDYSSAWWNLSLALLMNGSLREGFKLYHYRRKPELGIFTYPHDLPAPRWNGRPFAGKTLLVYCEQGLGDSIQFCRYLPMVRQRGGRVILEAPASLVRLFRTSNLADEVIASGARKPMVQYDLCASVMDLPDVFGTTLETIPRELPCLSADPQDTARWRQRIGPDGFKVGIAWAGNPKHGNDKKRSVSADIFAPLRDAGQGIRFFSLQTGKAAQAVRQLSGQMPIEDLSDGLTDFGQTAAAMMCLDLVISVDTSVAHMAGALGRTTWTLLPCCPDWRWLLHRQDSPWYPQMRLFRQRQPGNWGGVFKQLRRELGHACACRDGGPLS